MDQPTFEILDSDELAKRLNVPVTWVREKVRSRCADPIPHLRLGRYRRFQWGHPELVAWLERRRNGKQWDALDRNIGVTLR